MIKTEGFGHKTTFLVPLFHRGSEFDRFNAWEVFSMFSLFLLWWYDDDDDDDDYYYYYSGQ